jgi:hypothetical protein
MDPECWCRIPIVLVQYTTEFLNVVEEGWIVCWKNWKKTTRIKIIITNKPTMAKYVNKVLHSLCDTCSVRRKSGRKEWYWQGKKHREGDKPAIEYVSGTKEWWWHGEEHREGDLPAKEWENGSRLWFWRRNLHREGDKPAVECSSGYKAWYKHGKLQRSVCH